MKRSEVSDLSVTLHVKPKDIWQFFTENRGRLIAHPQIVAEHDGGNQILLFNDLGRFKLEAIDTKGAPVAVAIAGEATSVNVCKEFYRDHIIIPARKQHEKSGNQAPAPKEEAVDPHDEDRICEALNNYEDHVVEREDELRLGLYEFLRLLMDYKTVDQVMEEYGEEDIGSILDEACILCSDIFGIRIYRPMVEESKNGELLCVDYPYEQEDDPNT
jgi:hypothetical protein